MFIKERFVKEWRDKKTGEMKKREVIAEMKPNLIEKVFRQLATETGLITQEEIAQHHWNPIRPHALRCAFADSLRVGGVNQQVIDYMMGHKLPYGGAYFGEAYQAYKLNMDKLAIFGSGEEVVNLKIQAVEEQLRISREASSRQEEELISLRRQIEGIQEFLIGVEPILREYFIAVAPHKGFTVEEKEAIIKRQEKFLKNRGLK